MSTEAGRGLAERATMGPSSTASVAAATLVDPGLIVAGLAPCLVVLGHRVLTPGFASRVEEVRRFYTRETSPLWRRGYLEAVRARFVLLPAPGAGWLDRGWRRVRTFSNFERWDRMEPVPSDGP